VVAVFDAGLEAIANKGNGHYVYLDSLQEARRVMLRETDAMLETVAKDVKFQVEFNRHVVQEWKLRGSFCCRHEQTEAAARYGRGAEPAGSECAASPCAAR
jgi:hypothetical protein